MTMTVKGVKNKVEKNMILRRNLRVIYRKVRTIVRAAMKKESLRRKEAMIRILTHIQIHKKVIRPPNLWLALECPKLRNR